MRRVSTSSTRPSARRRSLDIERIIAAAFASAPDGLDRAQSASAASSNRRGVRAEQVVWALAKDAQPIQKLRRPTQRRLLVRRAQHAYESVFGPRTVAPPRSW